LAICVPAADVIIGICRSTHYPLASTMIATFKAGNQRKTTHSHLFLPKEYSGDPYASVFTPYTKAEVLAYLETGWGIGNISDLQLSFLYGPEDDQ
jgi:hypothetical protein